MATMFKTDSVGIRGRRAYVTTDSTTTMDRYGYILCVGNEFVVLRTNNRIGLLGLGVARSRREDVSVSDDVAGELSRWLPAVSTGEKVSLSTLMSADGGMLFCDIVTVTDVTDMQESIARFNAETLVYRKGRPQLVFLSAMDLFELLTEETAHFETMRKWKEDKGFEHPLTPEQRAMSDVFARSNGLEPLFHADARYFTQTLRCFVDAAADATEWSFMIADTKRTVHVDPTVVVNLRRVCTV